MPGDGREAGMDESKKKKVGFIGMPAYMYLDMFGDLVFDAFGHTAYLVGSATERADFRDVDVRMIVPDEEYKALNVGEFNELRTNKRWAAICLAFSELGKNITGLPIDFQIQQMTYANKFEGIREPLGIKTQ